ncbi:MAG: PH domain-containing protein [Micrococcales bacterium]|nr:PH domain-containing protein [Micrococcales bacterium]
MTQHENSCAADDGLVAPEPLPSVTETVPSAPALDSGAWRRMHMVTPFVRGWKVMVAILVVFSYQTTDSIHWVRQAPGPGWLALAALVLVVVAAGFGFAGAAWWMTRFAVTDEAVHLRSGVLFRQQRQARLDRLQAVDVVRPLLAQMFGLAELRLEVAGGAGSGVSLAFLRHGEAQALRAELLALAAGLRRPEASADDDGVETSPGFATAPERKVYQVPVGRLIGSIALSGATFAAAAGCVAVVVVSAVTEEVGGLFFVLPVLVGAVGAVWTRANGGAFFQAATSPDGIRLRHGLTESRAQTVPPGRVQAVSIRQGPLWRSPGWWRVQMNVAGYGLEEGQQERESVLNPVATVEQVRTALWLVLPDLGVDDPVAMVDAALTASGTDGGFTPVPRRAVWVDPVGWRRRGVLVTERALVVRSGRFWRQVVVVPHERTQSLAIAQGPIQRALRLASFELHSTPGPVQASARHLDQQVAATLLHEQAVRARQARAAAGPEQWLRRPEPQPAEEDVS